MDYVLLLIGLVLLIQGANFFVDGASDLARFFRVSPLVIGLTVVAFGTSAPEASVSLTASIRGFDDISVGNIVGSSLANILLVLGMSAFFVPIVVKESLIRKELPFALFASVLLVAFYFIGGRGISRIEGTVLLLVFTLFVGTVMRSGFKARIPKVADEKTVWLPKVVFLLVVGLTGVIYGGSLTVRHASQIAIALGMSEMLVGLTIIALGTSLPEMVTSVVAAIKKNSDIALGNLIGSNVFNILLVLGLVTVIAPIQFAASAIVDLVILLVITAITFFFAFTDRTISRLEGLVLILLYAAYLAFIIMRN